MLFLIPVKKINFDRHNLLWFAYDFTLTLSQFFQSFSYKLLMSLFFSAGLY